LPCGPLGSAANFFDASLVLITGVATTWILPHMGANDSGDLRTLTMLRVCRLVRLGRIVAKLDVFHEVWLLLRGLSESMPTLFWTVIVIFFLTYTFSVFGVVSISVGLKQRLEAAEDPVERAKLDKLYSMVNSIPNMMYTLIQCLTADSWYSFARAVQGYIVWSWVFFYSYMSVAAYVLMNLVTAIIVDNALALSSQDEKQVFATKQKERQQDLLQMQTLFQLIDLDNDDHVSLQEFESAFEDPRINAKLGALGMHFEDLREIFKLLDDGDGVLSLREFFWGIAKLQGSGSSQDLFKMSKQVDSILTQLGEFTPERQKDAQVLPGHTAGGFLKHPCSFEASCKQGTN